MNPYATFPPETAIEATIVGDDYDEERRITHVKVTRGGRPLFTLQITPEDTVVFVESDDPNFDVCPIDRRMVSN